MGDIKVGGRCSKYEGWSGLDKKPWTYVHAPSFWTGLTCHGKIRILIFDIVKNLQDSPSASAPSHEKLNIDLGLNNYAGFLRKPGGFLLFFFHSVPFANE
jgi:hypothetical protein